MLLNRKSSSRYEAQIISFGNWTGLEKKHQKEEVNLSDSLPESA